jgi:hypothetical protein
MIPVVNLVGIFKANSPVAPVQYAQKAMVLIVISMTFDLRNANLAW